MSDLVQFTGIQSHNLQDLPFVKEVRDESDPDIDTSHRDPRLQGIILERSRTYRAHVEFTNGYVLSVICGSWLVMLAGEGTYEIAVLDSNGGMVTEEVLGSAGSVTRVFAEEVLAAIHLIGALPQL